MQPPIGTRSLSSPAYESLSAEKGAIDRRLFRIDL